MAKSKHLQQLKAKLLNKPYPGCEKMAPFSDDHLGCLVKHIATTVWHYAGTCKMGPTSDKNAVVDNRLRYVHKLHNMTCKNSFKCQNRVYGVKGLRIADSSIMPLITSGNTNAPTIMIGRNVQI